MSYCRMTEVYQAMNASPIDISFPFLPENETEVVRQLLLQQQLSRHMKGPIPPCIALPEEPHILDVGCGVGSWCLEMARCVPQAKIVGIDRSSYSKLPNKLFSDSASVGWAKTASRKTG